MARSWLATCAVLALAGCPHTRQTLTPTPEPPTTGDASARRQFQEARAKFLRDGGDSRPFVAIVQQFPSDPIAPWAVLYAGIADVKARQLATAQSELQRVIDTHADPALTTRAQLYLGIAKNYAGDPAAARALLARGASAVDSEDERTEYLAALAFATAAGDQPLLALRTFDELYPRATATERAVIVARVAAIVDAAEPDALRRAEGELTERRGPSLALAATRLAELADQAGDAKAAAKLRGEAAPARAAVGLPRADVAVGGGGAVASTVIGALLPLGAKKDARIADSAIAALALAAGAPNGEGVAAVEVRAARDDASATAAVESLAHAGAIAFIGPIDAAAVDAAAAGADALGVPLISLSVHPEDRTAGKQVFHIRHSPLARAKLLADRALAAGVTSFAVTGPDNEYGKKVTAAFADAVTARGGHVAVTVMYPADTKAFAATASKLAGSWQAVFVADSAERLELIAPALATSGAVPRPLGTKRVTGGRPVLLLSTAEALAEATDFVATTGRYTEGALLAPGFAPDDADPASKAFTDKFAAAFGRRPGAGEAYAYDAAQLIAAAAASGHGALAQAIASAQQAGLTGTIRFGADHLRADPGWIYSVVAEAGTFAIHIAK